MKKRLWITSGINKKGVSNFRYKQKGCMGNFRYEKEIVDNFRPKQ